MKYLPILTLLFACNPQALNDFVVGEEQLLEKVIQDELPMPIQTQPVSAPVVVPVKKF
jgi:hypothetical protein